MTEVEWMVCNDPAKMFSFLRHTMAKREDARRKIRLWATACCRQVWHLFDNPMSGKLIEASEHYADGEESFRKLKALCDEHREKVGRANLGARLASSASHRDIWQGALETWAGLATPAGNPALVPLVMACLFRDIFGNPFQSITFLPEWRTTTVLALAQQMYDSRDFSAMPILADALMDADCTDESILTHCRGPGPHVRGCHVVDACLSKS